jgi:hypothetical protein
VYLFRSESNEIHVSISSSGLHIYTSVCCVHFRRIRVSKAINLHTFTQRASDSYPRCLQAVPTSWTDRQFNISTPTRRGATGWRAGLMRDLVSRRRRDDDPVTMATRCSQHQQVFPSLPSSYPLGQYPPLTVTPTFTE